jgi:hypothetical protein
MHRSNQVLVLFCLLFLLASCSADPSSLSDQQRKQIQSNVINRFNAMIKYAEAGELENVLLYFDDASPGSYIDGGTRYQTLTDMMVDFRATWKIKIQDYGVPDTKIHILSPEFVAITATSILRTTHRDGVTFQPRQWALTTLWVCKDGDWLIHSFHQFSADPKPQQTKKPA